MVEALTHRALALWLREGNYAAARVLQAEAAAWARTLGDPRLLALALGELGWVTADRVVRVPGDPMGARRPGETRSLPRGSPPEDRAGCAGLRARRGDPPARGSGSRGAGAGRLRLGGDLLPAEPGPAQEVGDPFVFAQSLEGFAGLAARQQQWERAAKLLGAAEGACVAMRWTPPAGDPEEYQRAVEGARAALGEAEFAAAWAEGRAMTLDQAISYALEGETLPGV